MAEHGGQSLLLSCDMTYRKNMLLAMCEVIGENQIVWEGGITAVLYLPLSND